jgi:hypothetical protein
VSPLTGAIVLGVAFGVLPLVPVVVGLMEPTWILVTASIGAFALVFVIARMHLSRIAPSGV